MKSLFLFLIFAFSVLISWGQSGPGGISTTTGSGNLKLWLQGDSISIDAGTMTLKDLSGYGFHFTQSTAAYQPGTSSTINGFKVLDFDGTGDFLSNDLVKNQLNGMTAFSLIFVIKSDNSSTDKGFFTSSSPGGSDDPLSIRYDALGTQSGNTNLITASTGVPGYIESSTSSQSTNNQLITFTWLSSAYPELYIDGTEDALSYSNPINDEVSGAATAYLGKGTYDTGAADGWDGQIAEVIIFNKQLNSAERIVVENYLASKYNLSIVNDNYNNPADFKYDVVGIGRESDGKHSGSVSAGFGIYEDNSTLDEGEYAFASHKNTSNNEASIQVGTNVSNCGANAAWAKDWYIEKTGTIDLRIFFDFSLGFENGGIPQTVSNYRLLYKELEGNDYTIVNTSSQGIQSGDQIYFEVSNANINNGYYTLGTMNQTESPVQGSNSQTWYTLVGGDFEDYRIWTLDPSGALPNNPDNEFPDEYDNVNILSGRTIEVSSDGLATKSINIEGRLELGTTSGHNFTEIKGSGRIVLLGDNFPGGDATHFITSGQGEGTVIFGGTSRSLSTAHTFFNVEIDLNDAGQTLSLMKNYTINGYLTIKTGTLQINDNSATTSIEMLIKGISTVNNGANFTVGTGNAIHKIEFQNDLINNGSIDFSNSSQYACPSNGAVRTDFTGSSNNNIICDGQTDLYRLIVNKGSDETYILSVVSTNSNYFNLYGPVSGSDACADGGLAGWENLALVIYNGTLKLGSNISIPRLGENRTGSTPNEFHIPTGARLWIDGATVATSNAAGGWRGLTLYGTLQVSSGSFTNPSGTGGITYFGNLAAPGRIVLNGGEIHTTQLKQDDVNGRLSYIQSGGSLYIDYLSDSRGSSAVFGLANAEHTFEMSGGLIQINAVNTTATNGIHMLCEEGNYNVTGGTFEIMLPTLDAATETQFEINSTVPFYNLTLTNSANPNAQTLILQDDITILNDLQIGSNTTFNAAGYTVSVGGNFILENNGTYTHGNNTTKFIGGQNSSIVIENNSTNPALTFYNLEIEKDQKSDPSTFWDVNIAECTDRSTDPSNINNEIIQIANNFSLIRGQFTIERYTVSLKGNLIATDGDIVYNPSFSGRIKLNNASTSQTITSSTIYFPQLGYVDVNNSNGILLNSDVNIDFLTLSSGIFNIGKYKLSIDTNLVDGSGFGATKMIMTQGLAGDRGLEFQFDLDASTSTGTIASYPIGVSGKYTPVTVTLNTSLGNSYSGKYRVNAINSDHPALRTGLPGRALDYYWKSYVSGNLDNIPEANISITFENSYDAYTGKEYYILNNDWVDQNNASNPLSFTNIGFLESDYTAAKNGELNLSWVFYSKTSGPWTDEDTWSTNGHDGTDTPGDYPRYLDVVYIGGDDTEGNHIVTLDDDFLEAAKLIIRSSEEGRSGQPTVDAESTIGHNFVDISGGGKFRVNYDTWLTYTGIPEGSWESFLNNDTAIFEYYGPSYSIPDDFSFYPNLEITGTGAKTLPNQDILVRKNLTIDNETLILNSGDDLFVNDSLIIDNSGILTYPTNSNAINVSVFKSIDLSRNSGNNTINLAAGGSVTGSHTLTVWQDILLNSTATVDLFNAANNHANLYFKGDLTSNVNNGNGASLDFNRLIIEKSISTANVSINEDFTLNGATNGLSSEKALHLIKGNLSLNNSNLDFYLSSGGGNFNIPSTSSLNISNATVRVSGIGTGIYLDGKMTIGNSSSWLINEGTNNYIEYSSSGNAQIDIYNGVLRIGSQLRRSTNTDEGILKFNQFDAGSTVIIGETDAPTNNRGVFEILNSGSVFTQTDGANITLVRPQTAASVASLLLEPETISLGSGAKFTIGNGSTAASSIFGINSSKTLNSIDVASANATAQIWIRPLSLDGNLSINAGTFDANGLNLSLKGNFINSGTFDANENTTTFNGTTNQSITGISSFYNLIKSTSNTLNLNNDINIENDFSFSLGSLNDNGNEINLQGDLLIDGTHIYGGSSGLGINMNGTSEQNISGTGTIDYLSIANPSGVTVVTGNDVNISTGLNMNGGIFDVGQNLVVLGKETEIVEGAPFSNTNMIRTNASFTDNGVRKYFKSLAEAGGAYSFTVPIGSGEKYTPVTYNVTGNASTTGFITIKAANERHPSVVEDDEDPSIIDEENVLQYYWVLKSSNISGFIGTINLKYEPIDLYTTSPYSVSDYWTAKILNDGSGEWLKYNADDFDENNNLMIFRFNDPVTSNQIAGDYTAGIDDAIPDQVPFYETTGNGNWTDGSIWSPTITGGPRGAMVRINTGHTVSIPSNYISSYTTTINGTLQVNKTFAHRLGNVSGTGTLYMQRPSLPAGDYDEFFSVVGGTLEYGGDESYDILANYPVINNLTLSGINKRRFPNQNTTIQGNFTIDGDDNTLEVINDHNQQISVKKNVVFNSGVFDAGSTSNAKFIFNGTVPQSITGAFTGINRDFYILSINNSQGLTVNSDIEVSGDLELTSGVVTIAGSNSLSMTNFTSSISGAGSSSYIDGILKKNLSQGSSFTFPVGNNDRYAPTLLTNTQPSGTNYWEIQYFDANPNGAGYNPANKETGLELVSEYEYWRVKGSASSNASLSLRWDNQSLLPAMTDDRVNNLEMVEWIPGTSQWEIVEGSVSDGGVNSGTISSDAAVTLNDNHYFTLATKEGTPLPAAGFTSTNLTNCGTVSTDLIVELTGTGPWNLKISDGSTETEIPNIASSPYTYTVSPSSTTTYTITGVDDATTGDYISATIFGDPVTITVAGVTGNPGVTNDSRCGTGVVNLIASGAGTNEDYKWYVSEIEVFPFLENTDNYNPTISATTSYWVSIYNTVTGCESDRIEIVGTLVPVPEVILSLSSAEICHGEDITLSISPASPSAGDYDLSIYENGILLTNTETFTCVGDPTPCTHDYIRTNVQWVGPTAFNNYLFEIIITDPVGCSSALTGQTLKVWKVPETGNVYTNPNE